jgi:hypothetical protein
MKLISKRGFMTMGGVVLVGGIMSMAMPMAASATQSAKVSPSKNLTNGKTLKISGKGWPKNDSLAIVECNSNAQSSDMNACNTTVGSAPGQIEFTTANSKGVVKATYTFATGTIGDGNCNARATCYITLTEPSATGLHALVKVTVSKKA